MVGDLVRQLLSVVDVGGVQHRHAVLGHGGPVAAQQRRQVAGVGEPGPGRRGGRKHPTAEVGHGHHLPFQPLGGVHGEDLHSVLRDGDLGGRQTVLHLLGGVEIGQQAGTPSRRAAGEVGHHVGECVEVLGARPARGHRLSRADLGVHPEHAPHLGDQIRQRVGQMARAARSVRGPAPRCGRIRSPSTPPAGPDHRSRRPGRRCRRRARPPPRSARAALCARRRSGVVEFDRAPPQRGDVASAQPPPRPGEHAHRGGARGRVGHQPQRRHHVGDLGHGEQAGQADDLDRHARAR